MTTIQRPSAPPLSRAATLPSRYYLDADILEREKERVFGRTWQLVARADELQRVGDFVPVTVLDEPIVITHGLDGELRGLLQRVPASGRAGGARRRATASRSSADTTAGRTGWTARCAPAPRWRTPRTSRKEDFGLIPVRVDRWGPFVFVNSGTTRRRCAR